MFSPQLCLVLSQGATLAQTRIDYQWSRLEQLDQWWHWLLLVSISALVLLYVSFWYRRDSAEQPRPVAWALFLLRVAALVGLLLYFLQFDKRTEQRVVRDSRVAILIDTSLSMSLPGTPVDLSVSSSRSRAAEAVSLLEDSDFLSRLAQQHALAVYRFDQTSQPVALGAVDKSTAYVGEASDAPSGADQLDAARRWMLGGVILVGLGLMLVALALGAQVIGLRAWSPGGWSLLAGSILWLLGLTASALAILPTSDYPLAALVGGESNANDVTDELAEFETETEPLSLPSDWSEVLRPIGAESRLGDALKSILDRELGSPLAAVVVVTDGRSNAGLDPKQTIAVGQHMRVPFYVIGVGSDRSPPNLQLAELDLPKRLYPGDRFSLTALVGSSGFAGEQVTVQVLAGAEDAEPESMAIEAEQQIDIPGDGSLAPANFELDPKAVGEWQYAVRVLPLTGEANADDNLRSKVIEVVERKNRVLIVAGGPSREYQFVRNLLYRDRDVESHVLLQTGTERSSQEAQEIVTDFPVDRTALAQYDAVLSFDADWNAIPERSVQALEQWVAEQAGGLLLVAGSVEMPKWIARSSSGARSQFLRSLSPVVLEQRGSRLLAAGRIESANPWPLTLTPDGLQTEFMWLSDQPQSSREIWESFDGVHSYYAAYELKPGAKALALFSDPTAAIDGQLPIYAASHFYGAGRVVFLGGSELWRLRQVGDQYFDRFYTQLVRWISQGRLLLDSDRGILLLDREQAVLGEQVVVRAVLKNERYEPLVQNEVVARLVDPQGRNLPLTLRPLTDGSQPGVYTGQFPILAPGEYTINLQLGGVASEEILTVSLEARVPAQEMQQAERHDALLQQLAVETGGRYWTGVSRALGETSAAAPLDGSPTAPITESIEPQDQVAYLPGAPDRTFELRWLGWLLTWIAGSLTLEWLSRRLHRLA